MQSRQNLTKNLEKGQILEELRSQKPQLRNKSNHHYLHPTAESNHTLMQSRTKGYNNSSTNTTTSKSKYTCGTCTHT